MGSRIGVLKIAAGRRGMTLEEYEKKIQNGFKWCTTCKQWKIKEFFGNDLTRSDGLDAHCFECRRVKNRKKKINLAPSQKIQQAASNAVNYAIKKGLFKKPTTLPCINCGLRADHYHHHLGYDRRHWLDVQALCRSCHKKSHFE